MKIKLITIILLFVITTPVCDSKNNMYKKTKKAKTSAVKKAKTKNQSLSIPKHKSTTRQAVGEISIYLFNDYDNDWGFWLDSNEPGAKIIDYSPTKYQYKYTDDYYGSGCEYILKSNIQREIFEYNELLLSDIGDSIVFVNNNQDTKIKIFKNTPNGHRITENKERTIDAPYILAIESKKTDVYEEGKEERFIEKSFIAPLSVKNDHVQLYNDSRKSKTKSSSSYTYGEGAGYLLIYPTNEKSISNFFNEKGEMLKDIDIDYFENHYINSSIAYLHDINTLYFSGEFYNQIKNDNSISPNDIVGIYEVVEGMKDIKTITKYLSDIKSYEVKMINNTPTICIKLDWANDDIECGKFRGKQVLFEGFLGNMSAFLCGYFTFNNNELKGIMWERFYDGYQDAQGNFLEHYYHRFPFPVTLKKVNK